MTRYSKYNFVYRMQKWMDSVPGQTFLNYANFFLFLGMGTEVFVFFISAFDRPFDKTTEGMELDVHPGEEKPSAAVIGGNGGTVIINGTGGIAGGNNPMKHSGSQTHVDTEAIAAVSSSVATVSGGGRLLLQFHHLWRRSLVVEYQEVVLRAYLR